MIIQLDMPKLHSPFVRERIDGAYVVTPEIEEGMEWVFEDEDVVAIEKFHGTNVSVVVQGGAVTSIWNRKNRIPFIPKGEQFIIKGLLEAKRKGWLELQDGQWFGELLGPKVNGNPYKLQEHLWVPFATKAARTFRYKSWGQYPKTYEAISEWFKILPPLLNWSLHSKEACDKEPEHFGFVEGIVFTHPETGQMAKLRRNMFPWYSGKRH